MKTLVLATFLTSISIASCAYAMDHDQTCHFKEAKFDQLQLIREVDRKTQDCVLTVSPSETKAGSRYQIISINKNKMTVLTSSDAKDEEKNLTLPVSGEPSVEYFSAYNKLLLTWKGRWILLSSTDNSFIDSNISALKVLK